MITHSQRDLDIQANATRYSAVVRKQRSEWPTQAEAQQWAQERAVSHGAMVYAIGEVCGVEASALVATYQPGRGWDA